MKIWKAPLKTLLSVLAIAVFGIGCAKESQVDKEISHELKKASEFDKTVHAFAEIIAYRDVKVFGFGLAANLNGQGSAECPPEIRSYMVKFIQQKLNLKGPAEAHRMLDSLDTSVVKISGIIPAGAGLGDTFDITVRPLALSQTTSLKDGVLYPADLMADISSGKIVPGMKPLAIARGRLFIDPLADKIEPTRAVVIGGGMVKFDRKLSLGLFEPNYLQANLIRNRIDYRFGPKTADPKSPELILLNPPREFRGRYRKFIDLVHCLYLAGSDESLRKQMQSLADALGKDDANADYAEVALESIGRNALPLIEPLMKSDNEEIRLRAARTALYIGQSNAVSVLREIAWDSKSKFRIEAIEAIGSYSDRNHAGGAIRGLLNDSDFNIRRAAYEQLLKMDDISISSRKIAGSFYIDTFRTTAPATIYVTRKSTPRIVLAGNSIKCFDNLFYRTSDKNITLNSPPGKNYIEIIKSDPATGEILGPVRCDMSVYSLVRTLGDVPQKIKHGPLTGVHAGYDTIIYILSRLCENKSINADFIAGEAIEQ